MIEGVDFAVASIVGGRATQQDDWGTHTDPPAGDGKARLLAVLADGMGGMPGGEDASQVAVRGFLDAYLQADGLTPERLHQALGGANGHIGAVVDAHPEMEGMGCTLLAAMFFDDHLDWLSIGDSLILLYRRHELRRINRLHVYANQLDAMVRRGEMTTLEAQGHPDRRALTSALQGGGLQEVDQGNLPLEPGDVVLLGSDGIATLAEGELGDLCNRHAEESMERMANAIMARIDAHDRPNQDNATVIAVRSANQTRAAQPTLRESP